MNCAQQQQRDAAHTNEMITKQNAMTNMDSISSLVLVIVFAV